MTKDRLGTPTLRVAAVKQRLTPSQELRQAQANGSTGMVVPPNLEVVRVASHEKQQDLLTLLHDISEVTALGSTTGTNHYVTFECPDWRLRVVIEKLFGVVDPDAEPSFVSPQSLRPGGDGAA